MRLALPADYIADGNLTVDVAMTRGRNAYHVHTAHPAFDPDQHGPPDSTEAWIPTSVVTQALQRQTDAMSAMARRRQLSRNRPGEQPRSIDPAAHISGARSG